VGSKVVLASVLAAAFSYQSEIRKWRQDRESQLKSADGWLTLAGLFWLKEGPNTFGRDASNDIALTEGPARAGVVQFHEGKTTYQGREIKPDSPDFVAAGDLRLFVIHRGKRYGIRVKDKNSQVRREFTGLSYFPVDNAYRVEARFVEAPDRIPIPNILGDVEKLPSPGCAIFALHGRELKLYPVLEDRQLFFIFKDLTSGKETYPAGRFLDADLPKNGQVILDFNKAYNPPCAFTPYATCPLPPKQNHLPIRIEAGERRYGH
jgi:uncharacterized protein (DUF1684 family)